MDRTGYAATGPTHAQYARQPNRMPPAMAGNYAQIDAQSTIYQRRPPSSSSMTSSVRSNDTFDAILASPASSRTSFDSWQSISRNSDGFHRPAPIKQYRRRREEGELFAALPEEVFGLILQRLRESHLKPGSSSCATCMMRDLCSVAVSAKKLLKVARVALYENIQLVGADSPHALKKRLKIGFGARLVLLRRTLRAQPAIAILVRSLKAPAIPQGVPVELYQNLIASVVMACPNLENLAGPHQNFDFSFSRLFHALSTREQLREMHWTLAAPQTQSQPRMPNTAPPSNSGNPNYQEAPIGLRPEQSEQFKELHVNWANLTTLSIHCLPGSDLGPLSLLSGILGDIPSLKHLHLSQVPSAAFNDADLLSLPALHTLTLSCLPGVSSRGLSSFARLPSSRSIRKLTLHHLDLGDLPTIAQLLSHLTSLETFALVQTRTPLLPEGETIWLFPYLASKTLKRMHWDIPSFTAAAANSADVMLAKSIAAKGFPALRWLRTPADPYGLFQDLCRPLERVEMGNEKFRGLIAQAGSSRPTPPSTPTTSKTTRTPGHESSKPSSGSNFVMDNQPAPAKVATNLARSRVEAQQRLEAARNEPRFTFNLIDQQGRILDTQKMAGYIGQVGSPISYCVVPDDGAIDENGGLLEISDILGDGGEDLRDVSREGCTGRWNTYSGAVTDKKDRERWWHTERGRWRPIEL